MSHTLYSNFLKPIAYRVHTETLWSCNILCTLIWKCVNSTTCLLLCDIHAAHDSWAAFKSHNKKRQVVELTH